MSQQNYQFVITSMKHNVEQDIQISEFIKDPASLKLLILAGTKIRPNEIATVNKCVSLIKLDLSGNQLLQLPLKFSNFPFMRILYLHDNNLDNCHISKTNLQYLSLFDNPIKNYRANLIQGNDKLLAIDMNVITKDERATLKSPLPHTMLKWPIVQISHSLQHEQDYLNLLKAQLFVINQVYKRASSMNCINNYLISLLQKIHYTQERKRFTNQMYFKLDSVRKAAAHWIKYTQKRRKLRKIMKQANAQDLLLTKLELNKNNRSEGVDKVMDRFLFSVRQRMKARQVLERAFKVYRLNIPNFHTLQNNLKQQPLKLYFLNSQMFNLQKILLFARKLYFNRKQYDICDNFQKLVVKEKRSFYIFRRKKVQADIMVMDMVKFSMGLVLGQKNVDRRHILYNRRGHKSIQIKRVKKEKYNLDKNKMQIIDQRVDRLYRCYDSIIQIEFKNEDLFEMIMRLIRYFNCGNFEAILQNKAAYFQTEVVFEQKNNKKHRQKINFTCHFFMKRVLAANVIQKAWRRYSAVKKINRDILKEIKEKRATNLIGRWLRELTFRHRLQLSKEHSFMKSTIKDLQFYIQMDIYMNLPQPVNLLRYSLYQLGGIVKNLYDILHTKTQVEIVETENRSWLKIRFGSVYEAVIAHKQLSILTYRYFFNGIFVRIFTLNEIHMQSDMQEYERKVSRLFGIKINIQNQGNKVVKKLDIDNTQPFFLWPYVQEEFASMFKREEVQSLPISVFIYNKNRRPLKINCDLMWIAPASIYYYRKKSKQQIRIKEVRKQQLSAQQTMDIYMMPHIRHKIHRERQYSMQQHKSLLQANRQRGKSELVQLSLLSQTLNIKRQ